MDERTCADASETRLSKSLFMAGRQCLKRAWLTVHRPELAAPPTEAERHRLALGQDLGRLARRLWPGGILVEHAPGDIEGAVRQTQEALRAAPEAIFEAAFVWRECEVRADVLARGADGWELVEVKSSTEVKDEHIEDVSFQAWIVGNAGLALSKVSVAFVDKKAVRGEEPLLPEELFALQDCTERATEAKTSVRESAETILKAIRGPDAPDVPPGRHCASPRPCPFFAVCNPHRPVDALENLPGIQTAKLREWADAGARSMLDVERFVKPGSTQERAIAAVRFSRTSVGDGLSDALKRLAFPACFIDFEAVAFVPPVYPGTRPWEPVPFQWSCHSLDSPDSEPVHSEFLATGSADPRPEFVRTLLEAIQGAATIVHYSDYEATQLARMARSGIQGSDEALALLKATGFDLLKAVKSHVYHPDFRGSFSIKKVLPALVPGLGYSDLEVQDGDTAQIRFIEMTSPATTETRREQIARALRKYCERDTLAMVELYRALRQLAV
jgi:predicted RecB family nuclease